MGSTTRLFDAVDRSQDNTPLKKYLSRREETMIGEHELHVGDCVNETIVRCLESAADDEEVVTHLEYAARELTRAAVTARRVISEEVSDG
jgi:hypothetical protein